MVVSAARPQKKVTFNMNLKSEYYASLAMDFLSITHSSAIKTVFTIRYGRIYGPTTKMDNLKYKFKV